MNDTSQGERYAADPPPRKVNARRPAEIAAGEALRKAREARKRSLDVVGARVGCVASHLSGIETGRHTPSAKLVEALARELGLDPAPLLCAWHLVPERAAEAFFGDVDRMRAALAGASQ